MEKVQFDNSGDEKFAARLSKKYEGLKWIDVDSKREMHTAMGDCVILKRLGKDTERKREKGREGGGTLYWICMKIMMRARTIMRTRGHTVISLHMISLRCAMMLVISIIW